MNEEEYEELARWLSCHPGRWVAWPEPFGTRAEADAGRNGHAGMPQTDRRMADGRRRRTRPGEHASRT